MPPTPAPQPLPPRGQSGPTDSHTYIPAGSGNLSDGATIRRKVTFFDGLTDGGKVGLRTRRKEFLRTIGTNLQRDMSANRCPPPVAP